MKKIDGTDLSIPRSGPNHRLVPHARRDPDTVKRVASTWRIAESDARTLGIAATTTAPKRVVTESAPGAALLSSWDLRPQVLESAKEVAIGANVADGKLAAGKGDTLTHNELASLAAMFHSA